MALTPFACKVYAQKSNSSSTTSPSGATYTLSSGSTATISGVYSQTNSDYNVVQVTKGTLTMNSCTLTKTGDTATDGDASSFYGVNSSVYANGSSAAIYMVGGTITSTAKGSNAIFAMNGGTITASDVTIVNNSNVSRGLHATYEGIINATNVNITTKGETSSTIATDRGGGTVTVTGGTAHAYGNNSAVLYSTGTITATGLTGISEVGEITVVEGTNSSNITNCTMTSGSTKRAIMMLQSGSGDATGNAAAVNVTSSTLNVTNDVPLCEVPTLNTGTLTLTDVKLNMAGSTLMYVDYNTQWSTYGGTGKLILKTTEDSWTYAGNVKADSYSNVAVTVGENVYWRGTSDADNTALSAAVTVNSGGTWILTGNSYVNTLVNNGEIYLNGYTLTYDSLTGNAPLEGTLGVNAPKQATTADSEAPAYAPNGKRIDKSSYKGVVIQKGKKFVNR